jgi:hypothetical protein
MTGLPLRYTANDLGRALVANIELWTAGTPFLSSTNPAPGQQRAAVPASVWKGKIPQKLIGFKTNNTMPPYPVVIVSPQKIGYVNRDYGYCEVDIACACWSDDALDGAQNDTWTLMQLVENGIHTTVTIPALDAAGNLVHPGFMLHDEVEFEMGLVPDPEEELGSVAVGLIHVAFGIDCPVLNEDFESPAIPPVTVNGPSFDIGNC